MNNPDCLRLIVTDANRHVRDLIKRELEQEGHEVTIVTDGRDVGRRIRNATGIDVVLLDPEILCAWGYWLIDSLLAATPPIPVIVHDFREPPGWRNDLDNLYFLEKGANSVGALKQMIRGLTSRAA